jgi:translation initiation factor IF-1
MGRDNRDRMEMEGVVEEHSKGIFFVRIAGDVMVTCTLSGKIRQNQVRILPGDRVKLEVSEYDTSKGRIVFRMKV